MAGKPKYHHLIPQTYMKKWCYSRKGIYAFSQHNLTKYIEKNIENNFGVTHYHSIKAGMPSCSEEDLQSIFAPLKGIRVEYNGNLLQTVTEYNQYYYDFENWQLYYSNGSAVAKKKIKSQIEQVKILDIEGSWNLKYESGWNSLVKMIEDRVLSAKHSEIDAFYKGKLMRFIVSLNWRSYLSNESLQTAIDIINETIDLRSLAITSDERDISTDETVLDWTKHNYLLKKFDEFLNDRGIIYESARWYIQKFNIKFCVATGNVQFLTSDTPSFMYRSNDGIRHIMPVTPKILICIEKGRNTDKYYIELSSDDDVRRWNTCIINNCNEFVVSKTPIIDFDTSTLS